MREEYFAHIEAKGKKVTIEPIRDFHIEISETHSVVRFLHDSLRKMKSKYNIDYVVNVDRTHPINWYVTSIELEGIPDEKTLKEIRRKVEWAFSQIAIDELKKKKRLMINSLTKEQR